ncbi:MAG: glycoside hydrolase family 15 protein, partial [Alphaproteobacteria bacterium]|nr:glycoside hydrolase family 15 protein [Alphaproteobacteria bacterium]
MPLSVEDYALIGDGETAALVHRNGSVDWLCWPKFDSDACFAALLGTAENGCWYLGPVAPGQIVRQYREDTLVLETLHRTETGEVRVLDFMPLRQDGAALIRIVEGVSGKVSMRMVMRLRGNYGAVAPWLAPAPAGFCGHVGACRFVVQGTLDMQATDGDLVASFDIGAGETQHVALRFGAPAASPWEPAALLADTQAYWRGWIGQFGKQTDWPAAVKRSLITLKALVYHPTGGMVAAPTTSLPEKPGGSLNWDYRFCWVRDASFTVNALLNAGLHHEVRAWRDWMLQTMGAEAEKLRIMYRVSGERHIPESEVEWLQGFNHARPVRIGNIASTQHQADVHGELLEALHLAVQAGIAPSVHQLNAEMQLVSHIEATWHQPGAGLWESRGEPRHYVYSRVMAWVGVDRVLKCPASRAQAGPERLARWERLRDTIHEDVCREGFHPGLNRFVEYYGGQTIDASLLLLPLVG